MASETQVIEDRVLKAIGAYESGDLSTIQAAAAAVVGAPVKCVSRRLRSIPSAISKGGHNKRLTEP